MRTTKPGDDEVQKMEQKDIFTIPARRCQRCGGILTSEQGLRDGYGPCCLKKLRQEERERKEKERLYSFFDMEKEPGR